MLFATLNSLQPTWSLHIFKKPFASNSPFAIAELFVRKKLLIITVTPITAEYHEYKHFYEHSKPEYYAHCLKLITEAEIKKIVPKHLEVPNENKHFKLLIKYKSLSNLKVAKVVNLHCFYGASYRFLFHIGIQVAFIY